MTKTVLTLLVFLTLLMVSSLVIAEAQNKTLVVGEVKDSDGNKLSGVEITVECNNEKKTITSDSSGYLVLLNASICNFNDEVVITAEKSGYKSTETQVDVDVCASSDSSCDYSFDSDDTVVFNIASKNVVLEEEPVVEERRSSGGSSSKKVIKNNTIAVVPKVESNDTVDAELSDINEPVFLNQTDETENDENANAPITGGVIGALKGNAGIVALFFIAAVLVAYMIVLRKRRSAYY